MEEDYQIVAVDQSDNTIWQASAGTFMTTKNCTQATTLNSA